MKEGFLSGYFAFGQDESSDKTNVSRQKERVRPNGRGIDSSTLATVLLAGQFQNGKSTLINCFLGGAYAIEGDGRHTTAYRTIYRYNEQGPNYYRIDKGGIRKQVSDGLKGAVERNGVDATFEAEIPAKELKDLILVDAPGWGAEESDDKQAEQSLEGVDFVIYLAQPRELSQDDKNFLRLLKKTRTYFCVVLNARDATAPTNESLQNVAGAISGALKHIGLEDQLIRFPSPSGLCIVNLLWAKYGRHMLDKPVGGRESGQAVVVEHTFGLSAVDSHDLVLLESGFVELCDFVHGVLPLIRRFAHPASISMNKEVTENLCSALVEIVEEDR